MHELKGIYGTLFTKGTRRVVEGYLWVSYEVERYYEGVEGGSR